MMFIFNFIYSYFRGDFRGIRIKVFNLLYWIKILYKFFKVSILNNREIEIKFI